MPPVEPMLARSAATIPPGMQYEAKWDGFRAIVFRDGAELELGSRSGRPLTRYFPELVAVLREQLPERCVLDGEIVIVRGGRLDFDALLERIHPADSRVRHLAEVTPASFVAFDLLALGDRSLLATPQRERRAALTEALRGARDPLFTAPATDDLDVARRWFAQFEGGGPGRGGGQAAGAALPAGRAGDGEGQARADRRLRRRGSAAPQERTGRRLAAARAVQRRGPPAARGGSVPPSPCAGAGS
ncbi:hypothetical protein GCM10020000_71760 [Streptomyces olivoverticillatus]